MEFIKSNKNKLLAVAGGVAVITTLTLYIRNRLQKRSKLPGKNYLLGKSSFTITDVLNVYKRIKRNMYPLLVYLERDYEYIKSTEPPEEEYTAEDIYQVIVVESKQFQNKKFLLNAEVFEHFGIIGHNLRIFTKTANEMKKSNKELIKLLAEIRGSIRQVCKGKKIDYGIPLPEHVTPEILLKVICFVNVKVFGILLKSYDKLKAQSENQVKLTLNKILKIQYKKVLVETCKVYNLNCSEEYSSMYIYRAAIIQFKKQFPKFEKAMEDVRKLKESIQEFVKYLKNPSEEFVKTREELKDEIDKFWSINLD